MKFQPEEHVRFMVDGFKKTEPIYEEVIDKNGIKVLKKTGETNFYEKIQEHKNSVLLSEIIKRYEIQPDDITAEVIENGIVDLTKVPENAIEAYAYVENAKNIWNNVGPEIQKKFNNDFTNFLKGASDGTLEKEVKRLKNEPVKAEMPKVQEINQEKTEMTINEPKTEIKYE